MPTQAGLKFHTKITDKRKKYRLPHIVLLVSVLGMFVVYGMVANSSVFDITGVPRLKKKKMTVYRTKINDIIHPVAYLEGFCCLGYTFF